MVGRLRRHEHSAAWPQVLPPQVIVYGFKQPPVLESHLHRRVRIRHFARNKVNECNGLIASISHGSELT
jgi:hypothetical protein